MTYDELQAATGVPAKVIAAIGKVESGNNPRAVRFEPHIFWRIVLGLPSTMTGQQIYAQLTAAEQAQVPYTPGPTGAASHVWSETNSNAVARAMTVNPNAAVRATSWGEFQDLGASLIAIAGPDPVHAVTAFNADPGGMSGRLFVQWVRGKSGFVAAAQSLDFNTIAHMYNGCSDCTLYASRLENAYHSLGGAAGGIGGAVVLAVVAWGLWKWLAIAALIASMATLSGCQPAQTPVQEQARVELVAIDLVHVAGVAIEPAVTADLDAHCSSAPDPSACADARMASQWSAPRAVYNEVRVGLADWIVGMRVAASLHTDPLAAAAVALAAFVTSYRQLRTDLASLETPVHIPDIPPELIALLPATSGGAASTDGGAP